jgi:hypothetical protein
VTVQDTTPTQLPGGPRITWSKALDGLLREWQTEGASRPEQLARLAALGYPRSLHDLARRRKTLNLVKLDLRWHRYPDALAYLMDNFGLLPRWKIAENIAKMTGYPVKESHIRKKATVEGMNVRDNSDRVTITQASDILGVCWASLRLAITRLGVRLWGTGLVRLIDNHGMAVLRAYYPTITEPVMDLADAAAMLEQAPGELAAWCRDDVVQAYRWGEAWRIPVREVRRMRGEPFMVKAGEPNVDRAVHARITLRVVVGLERVHLVPRGAIKNPRQVYRRLQPLGVVIRQRGESVDVATMFGCVQIPIALVDFTPAPQMIVGRRDGGTWMNLA